MNYFKTGAVYYVEQKYFAEFLIILNYAGWA